MARFSPYGRLVKQLTAFGEHELAARLVAFYDDAVALLQGRPSESVYDYAFFQLQEELEEVVGEIGLKERESECRWWLTDLCNAVEQALEGHVSLERALSEGGGGKVVKLESPEVPRSALEELLGVGEAR